MSASSPSLDVSEQIARIDRAIVEQAKLAAEERKLAAERIKLEAEQLKFNAEASKMLRDRALAPAAMIISALTAGAALFGAGAAFMKLFGG